MKALVIGILLASALVLACGDSGSDSSSAATATPEATDIPEPTDTPEPTATEEVGGIGATRRIAGAEVTLDGVRFTVENPYEELEAGQHYMVIGLTISNVGDEDLNGLFDLELFVLDEDGNQSTRTFVSPVADSDALDGTILPGGTVRGEVPFPVSQSAQRFTLIIRDFAVFGDGDEARWSLL